MALNPGSKLGPYEIVEPIGKGGMGEVYRARDPRMGREVAIKVSAEAFSDRFSREVHAVAALSHPNVCTLHDVGPDYLVMEMVEGATLAERIKEGPIPEDEALTIARQIALALEAAHEKNIVHRDLKPANIKLKPDGTVKVLDFGLAMVNVSSSRVMENSPTFATYATMPGMIVGTAAYMAPEQARGKAVDKRADIWSFGVVLAEMVSGSSPFQGEDVTEMLASVVKSEPELHAVPLKLKRLIKKCLEKDPKKRLRDIGDAWDLLHEEPTQTKTTSRSSLLPWAVAAALLLASSALAFIHFRERPPQPQGVEFIMTPPEGGNFTNVYAGHAPSPDGRYIAFAALKSGSSTPTLWLRSLDSAAVRMLPGTDEANSPFWSADSKSIAFYANAKLKRVEVAGGAPLALCDTQVDPVTPVGTWSREGVILFGSSSGLKRFSTSSSDCTLLTKVNPEAKETGHGFPQFLPDGNRFLYFVASADQNIQGTYISSLKNPEKRELVVRGTSKTVYVPPRESFPGYILWVQEQTLLAQRFNLDSLQREGDPVPIAEDLGRNPTLPIRTSFWASDAGPLLYFERPERQKRSVLWFDRSGKLVGEAVTGEIVIDIALSPDGTHVAFAKDEDAPGGQNNRDIWIKDLARGTTTRLTFSPGFDGVPVWSPDGKWIAYTSEGADAVRQIYRKDATGAGKEEQLTDGPQVKVTLDWSKDGKFILYRQLNTGGTGRDLMAIPMDGDRKPIPVVNSTFQDNHGAISPDGRWVAYLSNESGRFELYVQAFPGVKDAPAGRWQISTGGAQEIRWRQDGREVYYESPDGKVMAAELQTGPQGVRVDTPRALFSAPFGLATTREFDATPDGQKFLIISDPRLEGVVSRMTVITNWQATLERRGLR